MRLYINGALVSDNSTEENIVGKTAHVFIGAIISPNIDGMYHFFKGLIDEVAIYERALDVNEIAQTMYSNLVGHEDGRIAYWDFEETQGQIVNDLSGHGHHCYLGVNPLEPDEHDPNWVDSSAPLQTCGSADLVERNLSSTLAIKEQLSEKYQAAFDIEQATLEILEELFKEKEYQELDKKQIIKAKDTIHSAIKHQQQSLDALDKSINKLEEGQEAIGASP